MFHVLLEYWVLSYMGCHWLSNLIKNDLLLKCDFTDFNIMITPLRMLEHNQQDISMVMCCLILANQRISNVLHHFVAYV